MLDIEEDEVNRIFDIFRSAFKEHGTRRWMLTAVLPRCERKDAESKTCKKNGGLKKNLNVENLKTR